MKARLMLRERRDVDDRSFVELVVWQLPVSLPGSAHFYKYRLAYIVDQRCVLRYDNEPDKGDHKHLGETEYPYTFSTPQALLKDFWFDVDSWRP